MLKTLMGDHPITKQFKTRTDRLDFVECKAAAPMFKPQKMTWSAHGHVRGAPRPRSAPKRTLVMTPMNIVWSSAMKRPGGTLL